MNQQQEVIKSTTVFTGRIFDVVRNTVRLPNGQEALRDIIQHNGAAAVIPVTREGRLLFVRQYRDAADSLMLEIPAGKLEPGEDPLVCAVRELEEETGRKAESVRFLMKFYNAVGYSTEIIHIYVAEGLYEGQQNLDEDEFVTLEEYDIDTVMQMIEDGSLLDVKTIAGVLYYAAQGKK